MPTEPRPSATLPAQLLTRAPAADSSGSAWAGTSVMLRHNPDGTVTATSRGLLAVAATEGEALRDLARLVKAAGLGRPPADTLRTVSRHTG